MQREQSLRRKIFLSEKAADIFSGISLASRTFSLVLFSAILLWKKYKY